MWVIPEGDFFTTASASHWLRIAIADVGSNSLFRGTTATRNGGKSRPPNSRFLERASSLFFCLTWTDWWRLWSLVSSPFFFFEIALTDTFPKSDNQMLSSETCENSGVCTFSGYTNRSFGAMSSMFMFLIRLFIRTGPMDLDFVYCHSQYKFYSILKLGKMQNIDDGVWVTRLILKI